jgi:predicted  nucleic acid-binding Zn-ribbon protein
MSLVENLLKLYRVDSQVRGLRSRVESAERYHTAQKSKHDEIAQLRKELETRKKHVQAHVKNLEVEAAGHDEQLEKFREDLNNSSTAKQYNAVLTELNTVKELRNALEDSVLEEMQRIDDLDKEITDVTEQLAERVKVRDVAESQLAEREQEVGERLAELEAERAVAAEAIPASTLALFDEIAHTHDGEVMAPVEEIDRRRREYACGECNMHMPFEQVASLMGHLDTIVRCTACSRILYLQEEVRGALTK